MTGNSDQDHTVEEARDVEWYDTRLSGLSRKTVEGTLEIAKVLLKAQEELMGPPYEELVKKYCGFGRESAKKLRQIATNLQLNNPESWPHLPTSWATLVELCPLSAEQFEKAKMSGVLRPSVTRREIKDFKRTECGDAAVAPSPSEESASVRCLVVYVDPEQVDISELREIQRLAEEIAERNPGSIRVQGLGILKQKTGHNWERERPSVHQTAIT